MQLIDTHSHIHEPSYPLDAAEVLSRARQAGVEKIICVGTSEQSSHEALEFAARHEGVFAAIGVHPHDTKEGWGEIGVLAASSAGSGLFASDSLRQISPRLYDSYTDSLSPAELALLKQSSTSQESVLKSSGRLDSVPSEPEANKPADAIVQSSRSAPVTSNYLQPKGESRPGADLTPGAKPFASDRGRDGDQEREQNLVAIGEIGLDYFYTHSPRDIQIQALEEQIELALKYNLPIIFHVREAFEDFWPIFDNFHGIRGELHSFTDTIKQLEEGLKRGLYIGVNGISTFTKNSAQQEMFAHLPLERLLLETDAPFLTPVPFRGKVNEPAFVRQIAEHHALVRGISTEEVANATTTNAQALFALS